MAVNNHSLDPSEQKLVIHVGRNAVATGATVGHALIPFPCTLTDIRVGLGGVSGSPTYTWFVGREYPGAGFSAQAVTGALTGQAIGTSGIQRASLLASGNTLLALQAGDYLFAVSAVANTAVEQFQVAVVIQAVQDVKTHFGVVAS